MNETRRVLIVATEEFTDPGLQRLRAPAVDARALADVLRDPGIGGFEVRTLLNEPAHVVNLAVEEFFADRRPGDLLMVHFSGHGVKDEDGELYFAASNTVLGRLGATAVAAEFVSRRMSRSRSRRVVLLLDCCYAGAFERGLVARAGAEVGIEQQLAGRGRAVITASSAMEYAFEGGELADIRELAPSVFTRALVEGLQTGEADRDQDGMVGLDELYDYVYDKVRAATPNQTPGKWTFGMEGGLYIARRARPVTVPTPLPPELQQAMESPLAGIRAAAAQELKGLLYGGHAGMALAARLALERLAGDDSRTVTAAATAALGGLACAASLGAARPVLAISASVIDFGALRQHAQSPERRVRISNTGGGSLNARAATSARWLRLRQVEDGFVLAVDTSAAGKNTGTVTVESDGGFAAIRVQAQVEPALLHKEPPSEVLGQRRAISSARPRSGRAGNDDSPAQVAAETAAASSVPLAAPPPVATIESASHGGPVSTGQRTRSDPNYGGRPQLARQAWHRTFGRLSIKTAGFQDRRLLVRALTCVVLATAGVVPLVLAGFLVDQRSGTPGKRGNIVTADGVTIAESTPSNDIYKYQRKYPHGPYYAPVTGYHTLHDETGVEAAENSALESGDVTLTINSTAQTAAYDALKATRYPGAVVAIDPKTGAILAMASYPSYDPNQLTTHDGTQLDKVDRQLRADKARPLLNRALQGGYPPGSTFNIVTSAAQLTRHPDTTIDTYFDSPTDLTLPQTDHVLHNDAGQVCDDGSGQATLIDAFAQSCDTTFGKIGMSLGADALNEMAQKFGMNDANLNIPLPVAKSNYVIPPSQALTAFSAIGQFSDTVTPLQEAMFAAAIANGGTLMKPYLVKATGQSVLSQPVSPSVASSMGQMMRDAVQDSKGTAFAFNAQAEGSLAIAGKTGTAETGTVSLNDAAFTSFAPYGNPNIAVGAIMQGGGFGPATAGSIAAQVIKAYEYAVGHQ